MKKPTHPAARRLWKLVRLMYGKRLLKRPTLWFDFRHVLNPPPQMLCEPPAFALRRLGGPFLHSGRAFTLLELLLVVCVVAALMALCYPLVSKMRSQVKGAVCLSNVRTITQASLNYSFDHNGGFPRLGWNEDGTEREGLSLSVVLRPKYLEDKTIRCPLAPRSHLKDPKLLGYKYAVNIGLLWAYPKFALVPAPLHRVAFISELTNDTSWYTTSHLDSTMNKGRAFGNANSSWDYQYHGSLEQRGLNMGFVDGSARLVQPENNDWSSKSSTYGNATNGGLFYSHGQFTKMTDGSWQNIR